MWQWILTTVPLNLTTNQITLFIALTKNLTTLLVLLRNVAVSIEKQPSSHFSDEKIFEDAAIHYKDTLNKAGYINKLAYHTPSTSNHENKNKILQQNVIWFNPPYSKSVTTKTSQLFLHLLDTYFPRNYIFNTIFSRNQV